MEVKTNETMPYVPLKVLRNFVNHSKDLSGDTHITFEFLMTMCFPTIFETIQSYAKDCYTNGYIKGLEEGKKNASEGN